MDRQSFTDLIQAKFKMVRIEAGYTQDTMAQTIGLSKKTLVQIEKERVLPNWTTCVSICALFRDSEVLNSTFGCDPLEIVQTISRNQAAYPKYSTVSDIYWETISTRGGYILQANKVSELYRVLDSDKQPIFGTAKQREAETYFQRYAKDDLIRA
ncbi:MULTISPECIES: helix-turn-helix transcriptional regulator [unclassified Staphylococcus]|uniref:XRE family transcriptional regulator XdrA n=1 Tax=unclassified Staphylococcus TaxID=91994 RepID=UPI0021D13A85|nr:MULTISPECIES: helix-turn-helix transcriptional regulator [unclassified Staphylococcus]UXR68937.1 helix-turn-helix transcriptional regulator [Staphylococcus sp. IVB6246]UXR70994.1 helix-turn-helix transcriptional regulator [Staphylococcus sp. IVB6240]UXR73222.1 helix-turn-helix transcriptional regulator [Staphylococcus sp. IVB6238]UXR75520.1 helix-turn-helix transcriptional regulator [Staphylococcus sp. IVB6233]UXR79722.1 helix-turn-helix transcriptional regulator [Staphylococcus sp. IVB6218